MMSNNDAWKALPANIQSIVLKHAAVAAVRERRDTELQAFQLSVQLKAQGLVFNEADVLSMRRALTPFYARWKSQLGSKGWSLLEASSEKLG
jgi:TRAP-type C4-dicarboxylate transport system substrate-binding protein